MIDEIDPRESALPRWAQGKLNALRNSVRELATQIQVLRMEESGKSGLISCRLGLSQPIAMPDHAHIVFITKSLYPIGIGFDNYKNVSVHATLGHALKILPRAANAVNLDTE